MKNIHFQAQKLVLARALLEHHKKSSNRNIAFFFVSFSFFPGYKINHKLGSFKPILILTSNCVFPLSKIMKYLQSVLFLLIAAMFLPILEAKKSGNTIVIGGGGCGPKMVIKTGGKKKGNVILVSNGSCGSSGGGGSSRSSQQFIPFPMMFPFQG